MYTLLHSAAANILPFHNYSFCLTKCIAIKLLILKVSELLEKSENWCEKNPMFTLDQSENASYLP